VAITSDVEQMFYQFRVTENHRDYIRFFWYQDNDFSKPLIEYRMTSHVFGNTPSPAVATYGLRQAVAKSDEDVKSFVCDDFYVDDGLTSLTDKHLFNITCNCHCIFTKTHKYSNQVVSEIRSGHQKTIQRNTFKNSRRVENSSYLI
jgi:hypothetical protein